MFKMLKDLMKKRQQDRETLAKSWELFRKQLKMVEMKKI